MWPHRDNKVFMSTPLGGAQNSSLHNYENNLPDQDTKGIA